MEILGLLSGSIFKITDEILDTNYKPLLPYVEYSKTLCTIVMTIFLYKDLFSSILYIVAIIPICFYVNQIDKTYFKSLIPLPFIILLLHYNTIEWNKFDCIHINLYIFAFFIVYIEDISFPEETSNKKIITRIITAGVLIGCIYIINNYSSSIEYIIPMLYFGIGYCFTSVLFKTVFYDESYIEIKKKSE